MFVSTVEQLKLHRQIVEKAIARWRAPLLMLGFVVWHEYVKEVKDSKQRIVKEEVMQQITEELEEKRVTMQLRDKETQDLKQQLRKATDVYIDELDVMKLAQLSRALAMEERIADEGNKVKTVEEQLQKAKQKMQIERQDLQNENSLLHLQLHELKSQHDSRSEGVEFELNEMREELARAAALLAPASNAVVLADARAAALLAPANNAVVLADLRATALLAPASNAVVLADLPRLSGLNLAAASLTEQVINEVSEEVGRRGSEEQLLKMRQGFHLQEQLVYELSEISAVCEHFFNKVEADVICNDGKRCSKRVDTTS
jgi:hypothetical protein